MTVTPNNPNARYTPPDPGGRSRFLIRGIAIACLLGAVNAVVLMIALRDATPPPTPKQQPANQTPTNGSSAQPQ